MVTDSPARVALKKRFAWAATLSNGQKIDGHVHAPDEKIARAILEAMTELKGAKLELFSEPIP